MSSLLFGERHGQVIGLQLRGRLDVVHVLRRQRRRGQAAAHPVDALVVRQHAAEDHARRYSRTVDGLDLELDQPVVEQQHRARADVLDELAIVEADARRIAALAFGVEDERGAGHELDLAVGEPADANLRTLQVGHDRDFATECARNLANERGKLHVILRCAVREIQAHDVDAGGQHPAQHIGLVARGPERGDDLR